MVRWRRSIANEPSWNEANLGPTAAKRQHYVPQMYLRSFARPDDSIRVVDLTSNNEFIASLTNAAVEKGFNDLTVEGTRVSTEGWLSDIEAMAAPVLKQLIDDPVSIVSLSNLEEIYVARFIASLWIRTPAFRNWNDNILAQQVSQIKELIKGGLYIQHNSDEADNYWTEWKDKPDHWWLGQLEPPQPAQTSTFMLSETQGFANLLFAAPWRIGRSPGSIQLYTSDNPVSRYLPAVRPWSWWDGGMFSSFIYYLPLSPCTLLKIERRPYSEENARLDLGGKRRRCDFSVGEISFAGHVVTRKATRYLYGEGLVVPRDCAESCIERIDDFNLAYARMFQGFDPEPPGLSHISGRNT